MTNVRRSLSGLGNIMQLAFVPADFDAELKFWTEVMGVGPFFHLTHLKLDEVRYHGKPVDLDFSVAIAYWDDMQIELIKQHNDAPSIYKAWRDEGFEGLHHTCVSVSDLDQAKAVCAEAGAKVVQEVFVPGGGRAIYVDTGGGPGSLLEIIDMPPENHAFFQEMKQAAENWDGSNPVREI